LEGRGLTWGAGRVPSSEFEPEANAVGGVGAAPPNQDCLFSPLEVGTLKLDVEVDPMVEVDEEEDEVEGGGMLGLDGG
jgi:hypothetical protein